MYKRIYRKQFFRTNKYQRRIIAVTFFPFLIVCALLSVYIVYLPREIINLVLYATHPPSVRVVQQWGVWLLVSIWGIFFILLYWSYSVSNRLVGLFIRIMRELDDLIAGKERKIIQARRDDQLVNELLDRINILIKRLPEHGSGPGIRRF